MIRNLKLGRQQKILISSIFMLGGLVTNKTVPDLYIRGPIWSTISISSAVLCGNLPLLKPILTRSIIPLSIRNILYSWSTRSAGKQPSGSNIEQQERGPYNPLGGEYKGVVASPAEKNKKARDENRLNTIFLTTTVDIE
ncbi:hypothetical protein HYALB_00008650 [Hymenoscyphus albidus]|uniref:Uncharacterized protein n=1 Tax=Hymenoscyphus albidus TaxID=595503 RepID=A0A9N9Q2H3_9HELO|nr:hypothetical protein HYALB_00008650 [Hymenoscyphus albidus]